MTFETVAIIGAGTMGSGIATNIAQHGINVRMVDISDEAVERAIETVGGFYDRNAEKGRMSAEDAARQPKPGFPAAPISDSPDRPTWSSRPSSNASI